MGVTTKIAHARKPQCPLHDHWCANRRRGHARLESSPGQEGAGWPADQCRSGWIQDSGEVTGSSLTRSSEAQRWNIAAKIAWFSEATNLIR